ncbi:MAG: 23S rRNA (pseudouridine(1915)-N(3))-methyltransferase RlmH [Mycoplasmataceae bacterium]|nr:23S rRNA (pseudouridine(1915)-N(3))-methyltransferase RlmH [Mycoplasmataceae bacterium]
MIKIIAIGKKTDYDQQIKEYLKRLDNYFKINFVFINHSKEHNENARKLESKEILKHIKEDDYLILLDERGKELDNFELTKIFENKKNICLIIGGPYGVDDELRKKCDFIWSLGKLVYSYEISRLIVVEQIYRSQTISKNHPYHHK